MADLTLEQKKAFDEINAIIKQYELEVAVENNIVIPIPPPPPHK